jgi:Zn-dependent protease with chaperone function
MPLWQLLVAPFILYVFVSGGLAYLLVQAAERLLSLSPRARMLLYAAALALPVLSYALYFDHILGPCSSTHGLAPVRLCQFGRLYADALAPLTVAMLVLYLLMRYWQYLRLPLRKTEVSRDPQAWSRVQAVLTAAPGGGAVRAVIFNNHYPALFVRGWRRPELGVTTGLLDQLSDSELRATVEHELAHVRGFDNIFNLVVVLKELSFFSPAAHLAYARFCQAREEAADDAIADAQRLELAAALLKLARRSRELVRLAQPLRSYSALSGGTNLERRIELLLAERKSYSRLPVVVLLLLMVFILRSIC